MAVWGKGGAGRFASSGASKALKDFRPIWPEIENPKARVSKPPTVSSMVITAISGNDTPWDGSGYDDGDEGVRLGPVAGPGVAGRLRSDRPK